MEIGIEFLVHRIYRFETVSLEDLLHRVARHCESFVEVLQMDVAVGHLGLRNGLRCMSQDVGHLEQIFAETLNAETLCVFNLFVKASPEVFGFGQRTLVFVLTEKENVKKD